jgi:hypothetical protein
MKNPRVAPAQFQEGYLNPLALPISIRDVASTASGGSPDYTLPSSAVRVLKYLKFNEVEIGRVTKLVATVAAMASIVGWGVAAVQVITTVLEFAGILGDDKDEIKRQLDDLIDRVNQIYDIALRTQKLQLTIQASALKAEMENVRNAIINLANGRTEVSVTRLNASVDFLSKLISAMLDPKNTTISFDREKYDYNEKIFPGIDGKMMYHWIDMAYPFLMKRSGLDNPDLPVYYADPSRASSDIWDAGICLDLLIPAIAYRLSALVTDEPAYRSTGYDREVIRTMYNKLREFIDMWEQSFFLMRIEGQFTWHPFYRQHLLGPHPFRWYWGENSAPIPPLMLGCVDPVTGIAIFDPEYQPGFVLHEIRGESNLLNPPSYHIGWVVDNYEQVVANASHRQGEMLQELRTRCGIKSFYELRDSLYKLTRSPIGSEFVELPNPEFIPADARPLDEVANLDLGILGEFAGKPGKKYPARRYHRMVTKKFRFAMARRMDSSGIQLGYRLRVSVGVGLLDEPSAEADIPLIPYSASQSEHQPFDYFPSGTHDMTIVTSNAEVYDVIQSDIFTPAEEETFEETGSVPNQRRVYINPRPGSVNLQVHAKLADFDIKDPINRVCGFVDVEISSVGEDANANGFIAWVEVFETRKKDLGPETAEYPADQMALHFAPSFLVARPDYFADRDEGFWNYEQWRLRSALSDRLPMPNPSEVGPPDPIEFGPPDPLTRVSRQARWETALISFAESQLHEHPQEREAILARLRRQPSMPS